MLTAHVYDGKLFPELQENGGEKNSPTYLVHVSHEKLFLYIAVIYHYSMSYIFTNQGFIISCDK